MNFSGEMMSMNLSFLVLFGGLKPLAVLGIWRAWLFALVCARVRGLFATNPPKAQELKMLAHKGKQC